jgi:chorismate mutase/prephenate dehydrogenase
MSRLDTLRAQMAEVDRTIVHAVGRRLELAKAVGEAKRESGLPLRDYDAEKRVLQRASELAGTTGVPADLARSLMQLLISEARLEQERQSYAAYSGDAERIVIVGGHGKMGHWLCDFLQNQGHHVAVWDIARGPSSASVAADSAVGRSAQEGTLAEAVGDASMVVIATPLDVVPQTIREVAAGGFRGVLFDIASLKGHLKVEIAAARSSGVHVTSIHPMFGPSARTLSDKVIGICDCGDADATRRVEGLFRETAATLVPLSLDEHDRIASYVLGLSHLANLWLTRVLRRSGLPLARINGVGSTTFHSQMTTTATVVRDNPELYYAIQKLNPFTPELYETARAELAGITAEVERGDDSSFIREMQACRAWVEAT